MKIDLTYRQLASLAGSVVSFVVTETETGFMKIKHSSIKPISKVLLWSSVQDDNPFATMMADEEIENLYFELEENGSFSVDKANLPKYKYFMDMIYSLVKEAEDHNSQLQSDGVANLTGVFSGLTDAFVAMGDQVGMLNEAALDQNTERIYEAVDLLKQSNEG